MYKEELEEVNSQSEIEIQRLKEEIKALKDDLERVETQKTAQNNVQIYILEEALRDAIEEKVKKRTELEASRRPSLQHVEVPASPLETEASSHSISVFARVRPFLPSETVSNSLLVSPYVATQNHYRSQNQGFISEKSRESDYEAVRV